jgi:hypothetical protein
VADVRGLTTVSCEQALLDNGVHLSPIMSADVTVVPQFFRFGVSFIALCHMLIVSGNVPILLSSTLMS